jgi:Arm domain-containing DNA-binding protein
MKLTKQNIATIKPPSDKTDKTGIFIWDDDIPGFGLRIHAAGSRQWCFQYRLGGKQRRISFGRYPAISSQQARDTATTLYARVKLGQDPAAEKIEARNKVVETFGSILQPYLMRKKGEMRPRAYEGMERHLLRHCKSLHQSELDKIERRTIASLLSGLATSSGPHLANSVRSSLSSFFSWAMKEGLAEGNPVTATNKAVTGGARDRVLTDDELRSIWAALGDDPYGDIVRLLTLAAAHRDEIGSLKWSEVNFDKGVIELPAERTKNSKPFDIPLTRRHSESLRLGRPCPISYSLLAAASGAGATTKTHSTAGLPPKARLPIGGCTICAAPFQQECMTK